MSTYIGPTQVSIGLRATQTFLDITTDPKGVLEIPLPFARHMISFSRNYDFLGAIDLINFPGVDYVYLMNTNSIVSDKDYTNDRFIVLPESYGNNRIKISYNMNDQTLYVQATHNTVDNCLVKSFIIPAFYAGTNVYSVDTLIANDPSPGAYVNFQSPLTVSYTGANAFNLGQTSVTQVDNNNVYINSSSGKIINESILLAPGGNISYSVYNTCVSSKSIINLTVNKYGGNGLPYVYVNNVSDGSFTVIINNLGTQSLTGQLILGFSVS